MKLGAQKAVIEARVMRDKDRAFDAIEHDLCDLCERWGRAHHLVGNPREPLDFRRDRDAWIDQRRPLIDTHVVVVKVNPHDTDFDHALARGTAPGGLDIDKSQAWSKRSKH